MGCTACQPAELLREQDWRREVTEDAKGHPILARGLSETIAWGAVTLEAVLFGFLFFFLFV